ncbi:MAG: BON domain-containing protein [Planctomycetaceae bacterium]
MSGPMERVERHPESLDWSTMETEFAVHERCAPPAPHFLECEVQRRLLSEPNYQFPSLVIRRVNNGICLEGVLITDNDAPDVTDLLRDICGVNDVVNRLVVCRTGAAEMVS